MNREIIVGDIHGCLLELKALVGAVALSRSDRLVLVGDLLDKGYDSPGVVSFLRDLQKQGFPVLLVKGNHEERHERARMILSKGLELKMKGSEELQRITEALSPEDVTFLNSAVMSHAIPEHNALVVHAGILPSMRTMPTQAEFAAMSKGEQEKFNRVLRVRHVTGRATTKLTVELEVEGEVDEHLESHLDEINTWGLASIVKKVVRPKGSFVSLGEEKPRDPFWAEVYDGRFGHVFFGHNPFPGEEAPKEFPCATGLDLGCVFGGRLAAAVLETGKPVSYVSVPASGKFATGLWEE